MKSFTALLLLALILIPALSHAEGGCPPGQFPVQGQGWQSCTPAQAAPQADDPKWQSTWMAIAADLKMQTMGSTTNEVSEEKAKTGAIVDCGRHGGTHCEVQITARNSCAAMVAGAKLVYLNAADRQDDAEALALMRCNAQDTQCLKLYSGCSPPVRVR